MDNETTKVTRLTGDNVRALREYPDVLNVKELGKTTATFYGDPRNALEEFYVGLEYVRSRHGSRGYPVAALHAVGRKLRAAWQAVAVEADRAAFDAAQADIEEDQS